MKSVFRILLVPALIILLSGFQLIKTQIVITVRNDLGNTVEGATIKLYEKESDYKNETNVVVEGKTDAKGVIRFKDLRAISYFVLAEKGDMNNFGGGEQTGKLEGNKINKVTIVIQE